MLLGHALQYQEHCCDTSLGVEGDPLCFDDFWTFHRCLAAISSHQQPLTECSMRSSGCCVNTLTLPALDDSRCGTSTLALALESSAVLAQLRCVQFLPRWALWHSL
jgi:hypothetical protein